jgi:hypothetical protein
MPPNRKQVDITGEVYEEIERLAKQSARSVSAMARILLNLGIAKQKNFGTTPKEAIASFDKWGEMGVIEVLRSGLDWLIKRKTRSEAEKTGDLAIAFIMSQLDQSKIDGADLILLADALKVDGQQLQKLLNKKEPKKSGS